MLLLFGMDVIHFIVIFWKKSQYLKEKIPNKGNNISSYNLRNGDNYIISKCRLELYKKSFVPYSISKWNSLSIESWQATTVKQICKNVSSNKYQQSQPTHIYLLWLPLSEYHSHQNFDTHISWTLIFIHAILLFPGYVLVAFVKMHIIFSLHTCNKYSNSRYICKWMDSLLKFWSL
jgi:hypothetical protein